MAAFNTIQYCIDNDVPCFTFPMDHTKRCTVRWGDIGVDNYSQHLRHDHNGFAIITGDKYIVIDFDQKHDPPQHIYDALMGACAAVEKTPGGYHFWFLADKRTAHFQSTTNAYWDNRRVEGIDIRAARGICYTAPSNYVDGTGEHRRYTWTKGTLATAAELPPSLLEHLHYSQTAFTDSFSFSVSTAKTEDPQDIQVALAGLSSHRADDYQSWIKVGMALKHSGYSCDLWDAWSASSPKYSAGICQEKWQTFAMSSKTPLTVATIFHWLKEDNYDAFIALTGAKQNIQNLLLTCTNASIAEAFYEMNPKGYIYSNVDGWYILQSNNTWMATGSTEITSIPNILNTVRGDCVEVLTALLSKLNKANEEDKAKYRMIADALKKVSSSSFLKGCISFLPGLYFFQNCEQKFNERRDLFAFENGVIDLSNGDFRAIQPDDYITITCGYDWRVPATSEMAMVEEFLRKIWPCTAVYEYMLRALATTLEGHNRSETFHVLTGTGANGKSCLMDLCKIVFGDYFRTIAVSYLTKDDEGKDRPLPDLVAARYARMLVASEPEERDRFQVALLKLISGNDEIGCRGMYARHVVKFVPQFKLWILTNDMPRLSKFDQGIERRMRCVHFPTRFVANPRAENEVLRDEGLKERIKSDAAWRYGLLGLLLKAGLDGPLEMPVEVREFTEAYMLENNPVGAWLRQNYEITGRRDDVVQRSELYRDFLATTGISKTQKTFSEDIMKCNIGTKQLNGCHYYFGLVKK